MTVSRISIHRSGAFAAVFVSLLVASTAALAADLDSEPSSEVPATFNERWSAWGGIGATYGSEKSSYGELTIFAPLMQTSDSLFFTEFRAKYFEGDILQGNAAVGCWLARRGICSGSPSRCG